jgi:hypothetical protein
MQLEKSIMEVATFKPERGLVLFRLQLVLAEMLETGHQTIQMRLYIPQVKDS